MRFAMRRMADLQKCSIFLALLCAFLISDTFYSPAHGKSIGGRGHGLSKRSHKTSVDPLIEDLPTKESVNNPQVKKYVQRGIEKLAETSTGENEPFLDKILEVTLFTPAGKLLFEIKIKVKTKGSEDNTKECVVNVWRETDAEPSVTVECDKIEKKNRETGEAQPKIADLPTKLSIDDPEVKKYVQKAIDQFGSPFTPDKKAIVKEIEEATSYPTAGKLLYKIKLKIGTTKCSKGSEELNCEYNPEAGYDNCELNVFRETDKESSMTIECWAITKRRRYTEEIQIQITGLPTIKSVNDPEIKKYAEKGLEEVAKRPTMVNEPCMMEIQEANFYPPAGQLLYKIKMQVGMSDCPKANKDPNLKCECKDDAGYETYTVNVWKETDKEPSVTVEWPRMNASETDKKLSKPTELLRMGRKRREVEESKPEIADLPTNLSIDDPKVKKYAQMAVDKVDGHSSGMKGFVSEIVEAKFYPPSGKLLYTVKLKIGATKCPKGSNEQNCEHNPEAGDDNCEISVYKETDEEDSTIVSCWRIDRKKRAVDGLPQIADLPSKMSVDDPQVRLFAQKGIEKLSQTSAGPSDPVLEKILEATFFPPAGKLLYEIKMKVGSKKSKDSSQQCKALIWREGGAEPSVTVECGQSGRKKRTTEEDPPVDNVHYIADLPGKLNVNDPGIKKYAQEGLEEYAKKSSTSEVVLLEIIEAYYVPESIYSHKVKVKFGKRTCPKDGKENCEKYSLETEICTIYLPNNIEKESIFIKCAEDEKTKRSVEESTESVGPLVMDKPLKISIDDPEVKKYAQKGVEIYAESSTGPNEPILEKIEEASLYPPVGTMLFEIKIKIGTSTCVKGQKENCELKADGESKPCTVNVFIENDKPRVELKCN